MKLFVVAGSISAIAPFVSTSVDSSGAIVYAKVLNKAWVKIEEKGDALYKRGAFHASSSVYKQAVDINPSNWQLRYKLGRSLKRIGKPNQALAEFFQSLLLNEKNPIQNVGTRAEIASIFLQQANYDEAGGQLKQILELTPEDLDVRGNYAICLEQLGFIELACEEFNLVARSLPNNSGAFYNLGNALFKKKDFERAMLSFKRAIGLDPNNHLAIVALGRTHMEMGNPKKSIFVLRHSIKLKPDNHFAYLALAEVYERIGNKKEAINAYKKAIQINPQDPLTKVALSKLLENSKRLVQRKSRSIAR